MTVKEKLANKIEKSFDCICYPEELKVNKGSNKFNDTCSWTGKVRGKSGMGAICSWTTMTELANKKEALVLIDAATGEIA